MSHLTAERLRSLLHYDPITGIFTRITKTNRRHILGEVCGYRMVSGYIAISVDGRMYLAHRLAHLHVVGAWPSVEIDHCDLNKANNAWGNLREASRSQQSANVGMKSNNTSGYKGVFFDRRRSSYYAQITVNGNVRFLGSRQTAIEAHALYCAAAADAYGEFARLA